MCWHLTHRLATHSEEGIEHYLIYLVSEGLIGSEPYALVVVHLIWEGVVSLNTENF